MTLRENQCYSISWLSRQSRVFSPRRNLRKGNGENIFYHSLTF